MEFIEKNMLSYLIFDGGLFLGQVERIGNDWAFHPREGLPGPGMRSAAALWMLWNSGRQGEGLYMGLDRFELAEQIDSLNRVRKVLLAAERQLAALAGWLDEVEFNLRHSERIDDIED